MKPVEPIPIPRKETYMAFIAKINELVEAHNELLAKVELHYRTLDIGNNMTDDLEYYALDGAEPKKGGTNE